MPLTKTEWKKLEPKLRFRAFTVAKLGTAEEIEKAKKILTRAIKDGETYAATWQTVKETLNGKGTLNPNYWETVFRTNTQSAYIAGKLQKYQETNVKAFQLMVIEDSRTSPFCRSLLDKTTGYGMILPVNHQFWKTYGFPPYHFNCRTSICPVYGSMIGKAGYNVDNPSMNSFRRSKFKPQKGFGGNPLDNGNWWDLTENQKKLAEKYGLLKEISKKKKQTVTGASSGGILDKSQKEQDAYAKQAYEEIRKKNAKSDIEKVAKSSGLAKEDIAKVRNHLFFAEHKLSNGLSRFAESAEIANAWEALEQGRAKDLDIMLIKHELEELTIMEQYGYSYEKAHLLANRKYPWEYKKQGGWTDDNIQVEIDRQLKALL